MMDSPVLVTGAAGFIGSHLVDRLLSEGAEVIALDNFDPFYSPEFKKANLASASISPRFKLVEGDIRNADLLSEIARSYQPRVIVHLAAKAGVRPSIADPSLYAEVNIMGTLNVLQAAVSISPLPRFVFASSSSVYGDRTDAPFRESDRVDTPVSPYAASKKSCELLAHTFHAIHGLSVTGLRFFTAFGPRNRPDLAVAKFTRLIDEGKPVPMFGDGSTRRDYTYVEDIVNGVVRAIERCQGHHLYNLGHSQPIALRTMIDTIADSLGKPALINELSEQPGDVRQTYADISLAQEELGYSPSTPFRKGIERYISWYRSFKF